jgi:hypothetical protein
MGFEIFTVMIMIMIIIILLRYKIAVSKKTEFFIKLFPVTNLFHIGITSTIVFLLVLAILSRCSSMLIKCPLLCSL